MSDTLRIALVAEGITDYTMLRGAIESMLGGRSFDLKLLQPEGSVAFTGGGNAGPLGGGWKGVCQWCRQAADRGDGRLSEDVLFLHYDLLVLHPDADVANESPAGDDPELRSALPCAQPCPPASASTNPLRTVLLAWAGETSTPPPNRPVYALEEHRNLGDGRILSARPRNAEKRLGMLPEPREPAGTTAAQAEIRKVRSRLRTAPQGISGQLAANCRSAIGSRSISR